MQTSSLAQLKKELQTIPQPHLIELCVRLAKYKKENKELLHYLLFESTDEEHFIKEAKQEITEQFKDVNTSHVYYAKKSVRKILRVVNKHIKYSGQPQTAVELLIFFCMNLRDLGKTLYQSTQLINLYQAQIKKIESNLKKLHEDIQYDYRKELDELAEKK
jgi:membrane-anchored protein YejM (alkaline phosphatase superfamily)